jgi:hypothetical protein
MNVESKRTRKLSLSRETVRELSDDDLGQAGGAAQTLLCMTPAPAVHTLPVNQCFITLGSPNCA